MSTSSTQDISRAAGNLFGSGADRVFDDVAQRRLHYHLLRLTLVGLTREDVDELRGLARLVFDSADVSGQAERIRQRPGSSGLAVAIADIVQSSTDGLPREQALLGAILGAYTMTGGSAAAAGLPADFRDTAAVLGAVGGAIAASTSPLVFERIGQVGLADYLSAVH
ncbi:hypothetical protein BN159_0120 [Streptomyces davaonensis JCM 4913]|uniref:Uncharacterized protein n=1 Tax=Streptomyces davaonensis (strain DSM 101723 / JCM 4913 / KCC S-0913 / 768) TaxID=1214101 RepID=K4QVU4_STRDJ|nr:hypothetical protein [Streptomyces davaonensis]CCK24499.1 hypothetical protein BN159_0120 [Streptomyces davaonensis JCM 4913]